jgi:hypothetical protein
MIASFAIIATYSEPEFLAKNNDQIKKKKVHSRDKGHAVA